MFEEILRTLGQNFIFPDKNEFQDFDTISLTTKRVLLSDEFALFFDYFSITAELQEKLYELYYFDDKKLADKQDSLIFNDTIFKNLSLKDEFYVSKYWQYDSEKNVLRKYSEQMIAQECRFYEKNIKESYQEIIETKINNAELLLTRYRYKSEEENFENFNWFYGKQPQTDGYTIRFYFNIMPDSGKIANLINVITDEFDKAGVRFTFKHLSEPQKFNNRSDVAVLYAPRKNALLVFDLVRIVYERTYDESFYCQKSPLFTEIIARGLSFGENPDDRRYTSFGSYRSIYIAMAIIKYYYLDNKLTLPNEVELKALLNNNLDGANALICKNWTDTFYINQYSKYNYSESISYFKRNLFRYSNHRNKDTDSILLNNNDYLDSAYLIAQIISREVHFYPSKKEKYYMHCNWISYNSTNVSPILGKNKKKQVIGYKFKALDNTFLEGRLGVAHFLKQLHKVKKDQNVYRISYRTLQGVIESLRDSNELDSHIDELRWFYEENNDRLLNEVEFTQFLREYSLKNSPIFSIAKRNNLSKIHLIIDKVVSRDFVLDDCEKETIYSFIIDLREEKPFVNFHGNEEMCLSIKYGYALLGYFFLRLFDKKKFKPLPFQIEDK
jgi:hypothetical protein